MEARNLGQDLGSPEFTIMSAIDDSCVLFAIKDSSNQPSGRESQVMLTPSVSTYDMRAPINDAAMALML